VAIDYDFHILHGSHPIEEIKKIALSRIKGQVADVEAWSSDFHDLRSTHSCRALTTGLTLAGSTVRGLGLVIASRALFAGRLFCLLWLTSQESKDS
jgi:hypothetical protein